MIGSYPDIREGFLERWRAEGSPTSDPRIELRPASRIWWPIMALRRETRPSGPRSQLPRI
jgi:hypothetical protein